MPMRLFVMSNNKFTNSLVDEIVRYANGEVTVAFHNGRNKDPFRASALSSIRARYGREGHLFQNQRWTGAGYTLTGKLDTVAQTEDFVDHLHRRSELVVQPLKAHPLRNLPEYEDYYAILADAVSQMFLDRGITNCLFFNVPHLAYDTIFYQVAKAMDIPVTIVSQSTYFPDRYFSMRDPLDFGAYHSAPNAAPKRLKQRFPETPFYMAGIKQEYEEGSSPHAKTYLRLLTFLAAYERTRLLNPRYIGNLLRRIKRIYRGLPRWRDPFSSFFHENELRYFEELVEIDKQSVDLSGRYVYFPLQMQPEASTSALGGRYKDQAYAIECLADILPSDIRVLVKENPKQRVYMRGELFFHRLRRIPNVEIVPSWANTHDLIENSSLVATITGTAGWEAIRVGRPALVFGSAWYRKLHGVVEYREGLTWEELETVRVDHSKLEESTGQLLASTHRGVVNGRKARMVRNFQSEKNRRHVAEVILSLLRNECRYSFERDNLP